MTSKNIIWGLIAIVVIVGAGWLLLSQGSGNAPTTASDMATSTATTTPTGNSSGTQATTLQTLTTKGGNYTCSIETTESGGAHTSGTIYSAGGKTRLDLVVSQNGNDTTTHIIRSGSVSYTWVDGQSTGIQSTITPTSAIVPQPQGGVIGTNFSSTCRPWVPDATQFVAPKAIHFVVQ